MDTVYVCEAQHNWPSSQLGRKIRNLETARVPTLYMPAAPLIEIH